MFCRSSGFGFLSFIGRIAAILGNVAFGQLIGVSKAIPILITAVIMALGGVLSFKLPESKNKLLWGMTEKTDFILHVRQFIIKLTSEMLEIMPTNLSIFILNCCSYHWEELGHNYKHFFWRGLIKYKRVNVHSLMVYFIWLHNVELWFLMRVLHI